jgi:Chaperone of endosialidase
MKYKLKLVFACAIFSMSNLSAQQAQTGIGTGPTPPTLGNSTKAWFRGGNTNSGNGATDNVFGTMWNSPIYTKTNSAFREKLNGDFTPGSQYPINGYTGFSPIPVNTSGYLLLGPNTPSQLGGNIYDVNRGAFSLLHLNGIQNSITGGGFAQELGYRPWMKTGITYTGNNDLMYMGVRALAPGQDQTEMVISWSDNAFPTAGPDDFAFRFMGTGASNVISTNLSDENDLDGRHIARFAPTGEMGLGNTFGPLGAPYIRPQNLLHMSLDLDKPVFMQITNRAGTGETVNDGLHVGYSPTSAANKEAVINQKENDRLSLYANNGERIRIMQIGALNNGVAFNPGGFFPANITRIGVSHDPSQPVTRPLSLMHLGYNTGATNDGWRNWMDVGTFTANGTDNMYVGLKREPTAFPIDRFDAVINWGDNSGPVGPFAIGPDNLRFIFTSATVGTPGLPPSNGVNGVEGMRMTPSTNVAVTNAHVWTGIGGDPTVNQYGPGGTSINPTQTLEVNSSEATTVVGGSSGLRFTNLNTTSPITATNPGLGVLAVDADGDVIYVPSGGNAFGNICGAAPVPLTNNWEIPQGINTYNFSGVGAVNITRLTTCAPIAKFLVDDNFYARTSIVRNTTNIATNIAGVFIGSDVAKVHAIVVPNGGGNVGFGVGSPNTTYRLHVNGGFLLNGNFDGAGTQTYVSDQQFKTNIDSIPSALNIINQLDPKSFYFDTTNVYGMNFSDKKQYGLIAQDVELVLPELVSNLNKIEERDSLGNIITASVSYKALNYNAFITILIKGMQEQQSKIDSLNDENDEHDSINASLQNQINLLADMINSCCSSHSMQTNNNSNTSVTSQNVDLKDDQSIVLEQNVPNPFAEQTTINYFLPDNVVKAQMLFYNAQGKLIQSVDLSERGKGNLTVFASDLSNGIYTYTLVADGKIVETKKMVKQQ